MGGARTFWPCLMLPSPLLDCGVKRKKPRLLWLTRFWIVRGHFSNGVFCSWSCYLVGCETLLVWICKASPWVDVLVLFTNYPTTPEQSVTKLTVQSNTLRKREIFPKAALPVWECRYGSKRKHKLSTVLPIAMRTGNWCVYDKMLIARFCHFSFMEQRKKYFVNKLQNILKLGWP